MTFYEQQIGQLRKEAFQKDYLYRQVKLARDFIHAHFDQAITVDNMASKACFSKFHFIRLFKSIYNCTPHEYLTSLRMEKAKQLLRANKTVCDVCFSVGFTSVSTFKMLFKRHTRHTPFSYRQELEKNRSCHRHPISPFILYYKKKQFSI